MPTARIALDAMGGDQAPRETVRGALLATAADPELEVVLVGREDAIRAELQEAGDADAPRIHISHASEVVGGGDAPAQALRREDTSIKRAAELVRKREVDGLVAAGNTGAAVAAATVVVKLIPGVRRPGIAVALPTATGGVTVLCDAGANIHCKPLHLFHYGVMAAQYAKSLLGGKEPTVGLLNIGSEEGKGTELVRETAALFQKAPDLNYIGHVEGNDVFTGRCDVVVCEGFVGNVVLKTAEGVFEAITGRVKAIFAESAGAADAGASAGIGAIFSRLKEKMDWAETGGAPLLGLDGLVLISHGRSDARAIKNAIAAAARYHRGGVLGAMKADLKAVTPKSEATS